MSSSLLCADSANIPPAVTSAAVRPTPTHPATRSEELPPPPPPVSEPSGGRGVSLAPGGGMPGVVAGGDVCGLGVGGGGGVRQPVPLCCCLSVVILRSTSSRSCAVGTPAR